MASCEIDLRGRFASPTGCDIPPNDSDWLMHHVWRNITTTTEDSVKRRPYRVGHPDRLTANDWLPTRRRNRDYIRCWRRARWGRRGPRPLPENRPTRRATPRIPEARIRTGSVLGYTAFPKSIREAEYYKREIPGLIYCDSPFYGMKNTRYDSAPCVLQMREPVFLGK